ncbi:MAG: galactose oxidase-like domain-containing protein [Chthoniobacterales bacterium]
MTIFGTERRWLFLALAIAAGLGLPVQLGRADSPVTEGSWNTLPYLMPINPIHVGLMHTGKVLVVAGSENVALQHDEERYYGAVYDPAAGTFQVQDLLWDIFCTGMAALPDGRFLIIGGTDHYNPFYGESLATVFDPQTEKFAQLEEMGNGRWYGSSIILGDGSLMAFSGLDANRATNKAVELYNVGPGWSQEYFAQWTPPLYPRMHLLPNGNVFYDGPNPDAAIFNPTTKVWTLNVAQSIFGNRRGGSSVLLPLRPGNGYQPKVIILGGGNVGTTSTEIIDLSVASPAYRQTSPMAEGRIRLNAVLLPSGKVMALGGSTIDEDPNFASLKGEIFDPTTETWSLAGTSVYPRLYHSSALLLPDATVWVAGSNPEESFFENHMEVYSPAYLFTTDQNGNVIPAPRPTINSVTSEIAYRANFTIQTPNAADIGEVVIMKPGSSSHSFDFEQRFVGLTFSLNGGKLTVTAPPNGSIAPPGYYMVFILNRSGVPSVAKFVHLSSTPRNKTPNVSITAPRGSVVIQAGQSVDFAGQAIDPDGSVASYKWVFPGGSPATSTAQNPGTVTFAQPGTYIVSMNALDNLGGSDPSPPTRTIIVDGEEELELYILKPAANSTVTGGTVKIVFEAENAEINGNTFTCSVDGLVIGTTTLDGVKANFTWNTSSYANGQHTISGTIREAGGDMASISETVTLAK